MQEGAISQESVPLTDEEVRQVFEHVGIYTWALVDLRPEYRGRANYMAFNDPTWLINILRKINSQPTHALCNKLQLVQNPYVR